MKIDKKLIVSALIIFLLFFSETAYLNILIKNQVWIINTVLVFVAVTQLVHQKKLFLIVALFLCLFASLFLTLVGFSRLVETIGVFTYSFLWIFFSISVNEFISKNK